MRRYAPAILLLVLLSGCADSTTAPESGNDQNLLSNGSFEREGEASLEGWRVADPVVVELADDPGPAGGDHNLCMHASWLPPSGFVWAPVPGVRNGDVLTASTWMKVGGEHWLPPSFTLFVGQDPLNAGMGTSKVATTDSTDWTLLEIVDTITLGAADSVYIVLRGPACETCPHGMACFDLVQVTKTP